MSFAHSHTPETNTSSGEDTYVIKRYIENMVTALQGGHDPETYKIIATCKHYTAYDMEFWQGNSRYGYDARVSAQDMGKSSVTLHQEWKAQVERRVEPSLCLVSDADFHSVSPLQCLLELPLIDSIPGSSSILTGEFQRSTICSLSSSAHEIRK